MGTLGNDVCPFTGGKFAAVISRLDSGITVRTPIFPDVVSISPDLYEDLLSVSEVDKIGLRRWIADMFDLETPPPLLTHQNLEEFREYPAPSPEVKAYRLLGWMVDERSRLDDPSKKFDFSVSRVDRSHEACRVTESESRKDLVEPLGFLQQLGYVEYLGSKDAVVTEPQLVVHVTPAGRENGGRLPPDLLQLVPANVMSTRPTPFDGELLPRVHSDRPNGPDSVGVARDAESFARVIADRSVEPPLAIGLFGEWGSGKSYFMYLMQQEIDRVAELRSKEFCQGIVQINFNAWHYVEANLWSSLVDNILSGLHDWLSDHGKVDKSKEILNGLETAKRAKEEAQKELEYAKNHFNKLAEDLKEKRESIEIELNIGRLMDRKVWQQVDYTQLPNEVKERLVEVGKETGLIDAGKEVADLWELASQAGGGLNDLLLSFRNLGYYGRIKAGVFFGLIIVSVPFVPWLFQQLNASGITQAAAAIVTTGTSSAYYVKRLLASGRGTIALAQSVRDALESKNEEHLASYERDLAIAEQRVAEAQAKVKEAKAATVDKDPRRVIAAFIERLMTSGDYSRQLGIVASIRKDFEALQMLLKEVAKSGGDGSRTVVDRIVLYIDDLDRCPSPRVVQVLEAINLLLAFKLFVVVVGVDVRWITKSLLEHYGTHLSEAADSPDAKKNLAFSRSEQASPHDYLEKIFQIPFWLQPIDQGVARKYLTALIAPPDSHEDNGSGEPDMTAPKGLDTEPGSTADFAGRRSAASEAGPNEGNELQNPARYDPISFEPKEHDFILDIGEAAGTSPRRLKRFLNTYRVIKASVSPAERNGFVRDGGSAGAYRAVLALLAIGTGFPELARQLSAKVADGDLATALKSIADESSHQGREWRRAQKALGELRNLADNPRGVDVLQKWYPRVSRFTFELGARLSSLEMSVSDRPQRRRQRRTKPDN